MLQLTRNGSSEASGAVESQMLYFTVESQMLYFKPEG